jgi:hypothetical protein
MVSRTAKLALAAIILLEVTLVATNYTPGTWLTGWDNLHPEFNFSSNLMRSIMGVWQEVRGLGLVDGMSHIANLPHTLFLWVLSLIIPAHLLRYAFIFLMHAAGGVGMYVLLQSLGIPGLVGALFYLTNLATIQTFFMPLEAFAMHFAAIPWLAWSLLRYYHHPERKHLLWFLFIAIFSTPQFFVPTILVPIGVLLGALSVKKKYILPAFVGFLLINAFWLLPWVATIRTTAPVIVQAKINQMSSDEAYLRNTAFGGALQVLTHQGFLLSFEDTNAEGMYSLPLKAWNDQTKEPMSMALRYAFAAATLVGVALALRKRERRLYPFIAIFGVSFVFLANDTPGIREATAWVRQVVPLLAESMRFPFTKWAVMLAFSASVFVAYALSRVRREAVAVTLVALGFLFAPAFGGNFIYSQLRVAIPDSYFELFAYMRTAPGGRVAILPQPDFWSWKHYRFGYRGSGFIWYGMRQPVMDRAFDPWSAPNENYYWQLSLALYRKDLLTLKAVLDRYDIDYVLLDNNLISPSHNRALFTQEAGALLGELTDFQNVRTFGNILLYSRTIPESQTHISIKNTLPGVGPAYEWSDEDVAYDELGDYINADSGYLYTTRTLMTKRDPLATPPVAVADEDLVFDSQAAQTFTTQAVQPCGLLKSGTNQVEKQSNGLVMTSVNDRLCMSFSLGPLPHAEGYLVAVESKHISGRPLLFSLINETARHTELEVYLPTDRVRPCQESCMDYFVLPPLAGDGLGYSAYISNDAIGREPTVNEMRRIRVWKIPYKELLTSRITPSVVSRTSVLVYSRAYDPGWIAFERTSAFPFVKPLPNHVLVNNWANGWLLQSPITNPQSTIILFFLPQLWEFLGFALLPIPFLFVLFRKRLY